MRLLLVPEEGAASDAVSGPHPRTKGFDLPSTQAGAATRYTSFTMILPVYNEEARVARVIAYYRPFARMLVVDNFSADRTVALVRDAGVELVQYPNGGTSQTPEWVRHVTSLVETDYVVFLSASEFIPSALLAVFDEVARTGSADVVSCANREYTAGKAFPKFWSDSGIQRLVNKRALDYDSIVIHGAFKPLHRERTLVLPREERFTIVHLRDADAASLMKKHADYAVVEARDRVRRGRRVDALFLFRSVFKEVRRFLAAPFSRDRITLRESWARAVMHSIIYWVAWELRTDTGLEHSRRESGRLWERLVAKEREVGARRPEDAAPGGGG